jgi:peptidoglycan/xylan/chitin deacetylase (PgdA/CDA1 family)/CelD/BcsL family acetyltransferase involved in cellulose biosynthesis
MKVIECRAEADLQRLRPEWDALLERSASDTIFLTLEWMSAWWNAYGTPGDLRILLALDDRNTPRGIAPLRRQTIRRYGRNYSALAFIGDGSADSDYMDFIIAAGDEAEVMGVFLKYCADEVAKGVLLRLNSVPESSPNLPYLRAFGRGDGMIWTESEEACGVVPLPGNWDSYLKQLAPRFRTKIRSVLRALEGGDGLSFHFCEQEKELDRLLPSLFDLHQRRWAKVAKRGVFRWDKKRLFYREVSALLLDRRWLCFSWLEWKGRVIASQYGFVYRNRYFQLQEGYDPVCEHLNAGIGLRAWTIQEFIKRGLVEYDFLADMGRHKSDWGANVKHIRQMVLGRANAWNVLLCRGPVWTGRVRGFVKRLVPQRLLAMRDARQERRSMEQFRREEGSASPSVAGERIRNVLARCYVHSQLPFVLSPLRNDFRVTIQANGRLPHVDFQRRRAPSVRILYFHRVNDEGDPLFPAISTAQFEQAMRYIARQYRVVSLGEAVRRISQGGPPEPVMALTFDDGYQDNYTKAFPVLQRYGLPATIFLTTGAVDSREPLWFERLALAVKTTTQTSLELEIDLPRRIWLRNEGERLQANQQIYACLRPLPDAERRQQLAGILARLGGSGSAERKDNMLTWDQVRFMKARGIDFGGHTVTHPFVSRLQESEAVWEISECKRRIEEELQVPVEHFAYPSGREQDFAPWNKTVIREAGYRSAVSTLWGVNSPATDLLELRRGGPWEENPALFAAKLDWYEWVEE